MEHSEACSDNLKASANYPEQISELPETEILPIEHGTVYQKLGCPVRAIYQKIRNPQHTNRPKPK